MDPKKSQKVQLSPPKSTKKKLIKKPNKLIIDILNPETPPKSPLNKNSPKHNSIASKVAKRHLITKSTVKKPSQKSNVFIFPPEMKKSMQILPSPHTPKTSKKTVAIKPKTPVTKKKKPALISRPKTAVSNAKLIKSDKPKIQSLVTQVSRPQTHDDIYNEHLFQTFQGLRLVKNLPPVDLEQLNEKRKHVPRRPGYEQKKTVVFDLDETLVHCCENIEEMHPDIILPVEFPTGEIISAGINIRPHALECLKEINKDFEVFVFTASHQCYANVVLDHLDPTGELIHERFFRDSCINMNGIYVKDLRIFSDRNLAEIVLVDNASYSYAYQIDNGIPIISWHDDREDRELLNLIDYLQSLESCEDVREANFETFHLRTFYEDYMREFQIQQQ